MSDHSFNRAIIRRAREDETAALTGICLTAKRALGYDDAFMAACTDELTITPERLRDGEFWVFDDGKPQGVACLAIDSESRSGSVHSFFVAPNAQGKRVGRRLWAKLLERALERRLERIELESEPLSIGFYRKLGFRQIGEVPSSARAGRMLPLMELVFDA
ncbi:MAG: GNAT family N-acetyltransferase [Ahrensia sp.]|nr:GNAT family N-acetyltransferase [Ahrensia sp.]